uniref:Uncharacterized protein n=1 Tax=Ceratitis capitata TaxID=7213 RepID=W8BH68_CERCA
MSNERKSCLQRALKWFWICFTFKQILTASALPQNYFEQAAAGALGVANHIAEAFQNGAAVRKGMGFQLPGMSMRSKTEVGMGEAVIHRSYSSEEDSHEYRRKRAIDSIEDLAAGGPRISFSKLMRKINAPCHSGSGGGTGGGDAGGDDIVDEARRRMARMRARKAAAGKKKSTSSKKKSGRRRRQTELDDLEDLGESKRAEFKNEFRAHVQEFTDKMNRVYEHISASVMEMMQRMQEHFYDDANGES